MKIYETSAGVDKYIEMCEGLDSSNFKDLLLKHLNPHKTMLELGMGPGNDLNWLKKYYDITGSDYSNEFLRRAKNRFPNQPLKKLDAITIKTECRYDSIYSNKVFQHFPLKEFGKSLDRQFQVLKPKGLIIHMFWIGDREFDMEDMHFIYYNKKELLELINKNFNILESLEYREFEESDSLLIIAQKR